MGKRARERRVSPTEAKLALDVVRKTGDRKLEQLLWAAFLATDGLPLVQRYVLGPDGQPIDMQGRPIDVAVGRNVPDGCTISLKGRTWAPSRAARRSSCASQGRPRGRHLPPAERKAALVRAWERIWRYVGARVLGLDASAGGPRGLEAQTVQVFVVPPGAPGLRDVPWCRETKIKIEAERRDRTLQLRELLSSVPASAATVELIAVPLGFPFDSERAWRSPTIRLQGRTSGISPSRAVQFALRAVRKISGRKARFDPSAGPIRLACLVLRRGYRDLPRAKIGEVAQKVYRLGRPLKKGDEDRKEWRAVVRHQAGARRQVAAAWRGPPRDVWPSVHAPPDGARNLR